jgi:N,N'-diacetylchitobiose transport system permease protein
VRGQAAVPFWLLTPAVLVISVLTIVPLLFAIFISFTDYNQRSLFTGVFEFVGLSQYHGIFVDPSFWASVVRTVLFTGAMVIGSVVVSMAVSQILVRLGRVMKYVVTIVLICVWAMPNVAAAQVWTWLFEPGYGVINWLLTKMHVFGDMTNTSWVDQTSLAYLCIWLLIVWQAVPLIALTLYAAETQVSPEYYEAAYLDGASPWRIYRDVTLPLVTPTLKLMTVLSVIWDFNVFNQIWLITKGGPQNSTATLGIWTFDKAFVDFRLGEGSAIAIVTSVLLLSMVAYYIRALLRSGEEL